MTRDEMFYERELERREDSAEYFAVQDARQRAETEERSRDAVAAANRLIAEHGTGYWSGRTI